MNRTDIELDRLRASHEAARAGRRPARGEREGRALCLSGGGYRAALFHLGAVLRLHETGLLSGVTLFSSVSGGSLLSAWLAVRYLDTRRGDEAFADWCARIDFRAQVVEPFRAVVRRDVRTLPVLATLPCNWLWPSLRMRLIERAYTASLGAHALHDLPDTPAFVFCATDLSFGVNWEFSKRRIGDYLAGYLRNPGRVPLARAVAASAAFPPIFGPMRFAAKAEDFRDGHYHGDDGDDLRERIDLTDGGVYDNLATEPALRRYRQVLVSDAGAPFSFETRRWYLQRLLRYTQVVGNQAGALRKRIFFAATEDGAFDGVYWGLTGYRDEGADGYGPGLIAGLIGQIRTDLDRFLDVEFDVLVNHGYFTCADALVRRGDALAADAPAPQWPYPDWASEARVRHAMRDSHRRMLHGRWWRS